jgi:[acyl-carrier-protein] S-malonyltransferase
VSKVAFIFPGQGSQYAGMGRDLAENFDVARKVFENADAALGFPISKLCFDGPAEELQLTANTQPAILTASVAAAMVLREKGIQPDFVAGHSLGEYSALVTAGALDLAEAVVLVRKRGEYMQEAVPVGTGAMAAMLGAEPPLLDEICREAAQEEVVSAANLNSPGQIVIAGSAGAVSRAVEMAKSRGVKRAIMLNVSAPFHCALMKPAQDRLSVDLDAATVRDSQVPLVNNVGAQVVTAADAIREGLKQQVTATVRWEESMRRLQAEGVNLFVEVGPGKVLSGLARQIDRSAECLRVDDSATLNEVVARLGKGAAA